MNRTIVLLIWTYLSCILIVNVHGWSNGAPYTQCGSMEPNHGVFAQESEAPYEVVTTATEFQPNSQLEVTISGKDGEKFRGFLVQARAPGSDEPIGRWTVTDNSAQLLFCARPGGGVTHRDNKYKSSVTLKWTPPDDQEKVVIMATVVKERTEFWKNVRSQPLEKRKEQADTTIVATTVETTTNSPETVYTENPVNKTGNADGKDKDDDDTAETATQSPDSTDA